MLKSLGLIITILYLEGLVLMTLVVHVHGWFVHLATFRGFNVTIS